jgi:hypothetical protein
MILFSPSTLVLRSDECAGTCSCREQQAARGRGSGFPCVNVESGIALRNVQYYVSSYCSNHGIHLQIYPSTNTESYVCLVVLPMHRLYTLGGRKGTGRRGFGKDDMSGSKNIAASRIFVYISASVGILVLPYLPFGSLTLLRYATMCH